MQFSPCRGKDYCTEEGTQCEGCGRSHEEIASTRELIGSVAQYAQQMGYENFEEFTSFVGEKAAKKVKFMRQQEADDGAAAGS